MYQIIDGISNRRLGVVTTVTVLSVAAVFLFSIGARACEAATATVTVSEEEVAPETDEPIGTITCHIGGITSKNKEKVYDYWSEGSFMTVVLENGTQFIYTNECTLTLPKQEDD